LDQLCLLSHANLLRGDDFLAVFEGLPRRPPGAGQINSVTCNSSKFAYGDLQRISDGNGYGE
jgi:hypothetical protein